MHLPDLNSIDQELEFSNTEEFYKEDRESLASMAPIVAYVTHEDKTQLVLHSIRRD